MFTLLLPRLSCPGLSGGPVKRGIPRLLREQGVERENHSPSRFAACAPHPLLLPSSSLITFTLELVCAPQRICKSIDPTIKMTSMSSNMKVNYERCLLEYEDFMCRSYYSKAAGTSAPNPAAPQLTPTPSVPKPEASQAAPPVAAVGAIPIFPTVEAAAAAGRTKPCPAEARPSGPAGSSSAQPATTPALPLASLSAPAAAMDPRLPSAGALPPLSVGAPQTHPTGTVPVLSASPMASVPSAPPPAFTTATAAAAGSVGSTVPARSSSAAVAQGSPGLAASGAPRTSAGLPAAEGGKASLHGTSETNAAGPSVPSPQPPRHSLPSAGKPPAAAAAAPAPAAATPAAAAIEEIKPPPRLSPEPESSDTSIQAFRIREKNRVRLYRYNVYLEARMRAIKSLQGRQQLQEQQQQQRRQRRPSNESRGGSSSRNGPRDPLPRAPEPEKEAESKGSGSSKPFQPCVLETMAEAHRKLLQQRRQGPPWLVPGGSVPVPGVAVIPVGTQGELPQKRKRSSEASGGGKSKVGRDRGLLSYPSCMGGLNVAHIMAAGALIMCGWPPSPLSNQGGPRAPSVWSFPGSAKRRMAPPTWAGPSWAPEPAGESRVLHEWHTSLHAGGAPDTSVLPMSCFFLFIPGSPKPQAPPPQPPQQLPTLQQPQQKSRKRERSPTMTTRPSATMTTRQSDGSSGGAFRGVTFSRRMKKWRAQVRCDNDLQPLGVFPTAEDAARAYDVRALQLFGSRAQLNFPR